MSRFVYSPCLPGRGPNRPARLSAPAVRKGALFQGVFLHAAGNSTDASDATQGAARRDARLARLEAVLLLAGEPLSTRKLAQFTSLADGTEARTLIRTLNRLYDAQATAFRVEEVAGGFQLMTRARFAPWLRRLYQTPVETRLSSPALETLAVVAYRQPVLRAEIEAVRGVQSGEILRQLMERDLVRITGRSPELGRPFLYGTTRRFLQTFGLRNLDELPRAEALRSVSVNSTLPAEPESQPKDKPQTEDRTPDVTGPSDTPFPSNRQEEPEVRISLPTAPQSTELLDRPADDWLSEIPAVIAAKDDDDDDDFDDDDEDEDDDDEDDLEEDEWEEVDDDVDDEEFDEDDEDWDDEDDDWDDEDEDEDDLDDDE